MRFILLLAAACAAYAASAPSVTGIAATFHDGQTFLTWTDAATGSAGANYRYEVYRSTSPIVDATSLAAATFLQEAFNNSGQLVAAGGTWNQTTRQNGALPMSIIQQGSCGGPTYTACGTQLPAFTGLAVHTVTANASAYYAVITHDRTGALSDSPVTPGSNATTSPVSESVGIVLPMKIYDSHDTVNRNAGTSSVTISGTTNLPLWFSFSGDGACTDYKSGSLAFGDLWQYYGDSTMGYQEGVPEAFSVSEDHTGSQFGVRSLYLSHCSLVWTNSGLGSFDPIYSGYLWPDSNTYQTYVEKAIMSYAQWAIANYGANPNRIYQSGQSAGGYAGDVAILHPEVFAAVFDSAAEWERQVIPSMITGSIITATSSMLMAGTNQKFLDRMNMPAYISSHCGSLPFIAFSVGRNDTSQGNIWIGMLDMVAALKACHAGFAFAWNNGTHSDGPAAMAFLRTTYQTAIAKNVSYPAFANDSADNNMGNGSSTNGDCNTGSPGSTCFVNGGFSWTTPTETSTTWSAAISNTGATLTVDITPRNSQAFHLTPGQLVNWTASTGQKGTVAADVWGLATAPGVTVNAGAATTVAFQPVTGGVVLSGLVSASGIAVIH